MKRGGQGWQAFWDATGGQVYPLNDSQGHELGDNRVACPCQPYWQPESNDLLVHNSFDGREHNEEQYIERQAKRVLQ